MYTTVKERIIAEFRLTSREYLHRFRNAKKYQNDTYTMFSSRLASLLSYYFRSRDAEKNVDKMFDVIVSDKLKDCLSTGALNYVLSLEGDGTFPSSKIATNADIYDNNHVDINEGKSRTITSVSDRSSFENNNSTRGRGKWFAGRPIGTVGQDLSKNVQTSNIAQAKDNALEVRRCFRFQSTSHIAKQCDKKVDSTVRVQACMTLEPHLLHSVTDANIGLCKQNRLNNLIY